MIIATALSLVLIASPAGAASARERMMLWRQRWQLRREMMKFEVLPARTRLVARVVGEQELSAAFGSSNTLSCGTGLPDWQNELMRSGVGRDHGPLFMHGRRAATETAERLVVVDEVCLADPTDLYFQVLVLDERPNERESAAASGNPDSAKRFVKVALPIDPSASVRVFSGEWDAKDPSRFVIPFAASDGTRGVVEGILQGGHEVTFTARATSRVAPGDPMPPSTQRAHDHGYPITPRERDR